MERWCIGEEIHNAFRIFVVAIPEDLNEYIRVSSISVLCIDGTFYYDNNTAETVNAWETEKRALTPEWARKFIYGYREGMKLTVVLHHLRGIRTPYLEEVSRYTGTCSPS